jgi:hypothetical protein
VTSITQNESSTKLKHREASENNLQKWSDKGVNQGVKEERFLS